MPLSSPPPAIANRTDPQRAQRRRQPMLRARMLFLWYAVRLTAPRVVGLAAVTVLAGLVFHARQGQAEGMSLLEAFYDAYTQLYLEHTRPLPADPVLQVFYFALPLVGALVLAEGVFKLGASFLDFQNHRDAWMRIMTKTYRDHIVLVGLGTVGFRVLEELVARDMRVTVCESRGDSSFVEEARALGIPVLIGDARRDALLRELGVERARCVIACTDNDLVNLEVAMDARAIHPGVRLILRMFDQGLATKLGNAFSFDSTFSTSALAAPLFAAAAIDERVHGAYRLGDTMMLSVEVDVRPDSRLAEQTLQEAQLRLGAPVVGLRRQGGVATHRFERSEILHAGDAVVCHVAAEEVAALRSRANAPSSGA